MEYINIVNPIEISERILLKAGKRPRPKANTIGSSDDKKLLKNHSFYGGHYLFKNLVHF